MSNENVHPAFKGILDSISGEDSYKITIPRPYHEDGKIPTSEGDKTIPEIMDCLMWGSYKSHRDRGETSHEQLVKFGIGNEQMRERWEREQLNKKS